MKELYIPVDDQINLQARFTKAAPKSKNKNIIAIILHPYGPLGGCYNDHVVVAMERLMLQECSVSTCCLNMRGVGKSGGRTSWTCTPERDDVVAAAAFLTSNAKELLLLDGDDSQCRIILIGYSFGSVVACFAAPEIPNLSAVVSISYPASVLWALASFQTHSIYQALESINPDVYKLFVIGDCDNFSSIAAWQDGVVDLVHEPKNMTVFPGVDHFYRSKVAMEALVNSVAGYLHCLVKN